MITTVCLEAGLCFGPLPTDWMIADPGYLIAQTTNDTLPELPTLMVNPKNLSEPFRLIEWVCNLRSARCPAEQNVELVRARTTGLPYYRIMRRIEAGQELFVWFRRSDIEKTMGLLLRQQPTLLNRWLELTSHTPGFSEAPRQVTDPLQCYRCDRRFQYIYPLISHCLFQCGRQPGTMKQKDGITGSYDSAPHLGHHSKAAETVMRDVIRQEPLRHLAIKDVALCKMFPVQVPVLEAIADKRSRSPVVTLTDCNRLSAEPLGKSTWTHNIPTHFDQSITITTSGADVGSSKHPKLADCPLSQLHTHKPVTAAPKSTTDKNTSWAAKSKNPLVEQLLRTLPKSEDTLVVISTKAEEPNTFSITQNWCARCAMTFRLTGDLVQHMRTHHNRGLVGTRIRTGSKLHGRPADADRMTVSKVSSKKRPMEKSNMAVARRDMGFPIRTTVACHLCGETFRERHHLTRHMTSHE